MDTLVTTNTLMEFWLARDTEKRYVCARCWGRLVAKKAQDFRQADVVCANREAGLCDGRGFVTQAYAERRRRESIAEYFEVLRNYPDLLPKRVVTERQVLAELGF